MLNLLSLAGGFLLRLIGGALLSLLTEKFIVKVIIRILSWLASKTHTKVDDELVASMREEWERANTPGGGGGQ